MSWSHLENTLETRGVSVSVKPEATSMLFAACRAAGVGGASPAWAADPMIAPIAARNSVFNRLELRVMEVSRGVVKSESRSPSMEILIVFALASCHDDLQNTIGRRRT